MDRFFEIEEDRQRATVPFQLINNFIVIDVLVNDHPQKFIIDTGFATPILFDCESHPNLKLASKSVQFSGAGKGQPVVGQWAMDVDIRLPGIYSDQVSIIAMKREDLEIGSNVKIDGVLGFQLFNSLVVHIDYQILLIHFYRPEEFAPNSDFSSTLLEVDFTKPYVYLKFDNQGKLDSARMFLDLGANLHMMLMKNSPFSQKVIASKRSKMIGYGLSGRIMGRKGTASSFTLAGLSHSKVPVYIVNQENYGLTEDLNNRQGSLGNQFLIDFEVVIDYVGRKIYLKPYPQNQTILAKNN